MIKNNRKIVLILDNLRSTYNVGSLFRTAEGLGVLKIYLTGITPYPEVVNDQRLPHLKNKITAQIDKTSLGSIGYIKFQYTPNTGQVLTKLRRDGYQIVALEQSPRAQLINDFEVSHNKIALIVGNELSGITKNILDKADNIIEIKMLGKKESFNVVQAAAMALFYLAFN